MEPNQVTSPEAIPEIYKKARQAQKGWAALSVKKRAQHLLNLRETILNHVDELVNLISENNGKPHFEAMISDLLPSAEVLTYFARKGPKLLKDKSVPLLNPVFLHRKSYLNYWPLGTVAIIAPWNFPFFLPMGEIAMALVSGNAVVFKPSEFAFAEGLKIQELCDEAGIPPNIFQTVFGDGKLGQAIVENKPDKVFFTGSVETGKKVAETAAKNLTPVCLELGGKDPMIVLPDADLDYATSAALWGAFGNSGQMCSSTERLLLHETIADPFLKLYKEKIEKLRQGDPQVSQTEGPQTDLGRTTVEKQKLVYKAHLKDAKEKGASFLTGGSFTQDGKFLKPTVVVGKNVEDLKIYKDETFGPVVAVTTFKSVSEAVKKCNSSRYGLLASVITRNPSLGEDIAKQLESGTVNINEVAYTCGLPETPWGGMKDTGIGIKHSDQGLLEFVRTRHIHKPRLSALSFIKSFWWFPYSKFQYDTFRQFFELYRRSWILKIKALPQFLWNFVTFLKKEKRL